MEKKSPGSQQNAIELLKNDHEQVLQLFSEFEQMQDEEEEPDTRRDVIEQACAQLTIHAQIEEELFYPALRDVIDEQELLDEAKVEHETAKQLIAELQSMSPDEDLYSAKFTVLGEYVKHHIEEEQKELFPLAKKAQIDLKTLGADLLDRKKELMAEFGMVFDEEEAQLTAPPTSGKKTSRHPRT